MENGSRSEAWDRFGASYYQSYGPRDESGQLKSPPYERGVGWEQFFGAVGDHITDELQPKTALDAGCAIGFLVEALRQRGVDACGFDISEWAIAQVPESLRPYCHVRSLTAEISGSFDLITCIEVVEHLPAYEATAAIANICRHTDTVLFSSSPADFLEPTHVNVQPPDYWVSLFASHGFFRDVRYDATYLAPQAVLLRRQHLSPAELVERYERAWFQTGQLLSGVQETRDRLIQELETAQASVSDLAADLERARSRIAKQNLAENTVEIENAELTVERNALSTQVSQISAELEATRQTKLFRYSAGLRRVYARVRRLKPGGPRGQ
jgi:2-polyprenyl-3-methyl-5-hydroxy-6-metoxy-1,4-benzoquinol methylase